MAAAKSMLSEYYTKGNVDVKDHDPKQEFSNIPDDTIVVRVKRGSKIMNIMGFVEKSLKEEKNRYMIFTGCGDAIEKTISCVEITKTKFQGLHQINRLSALRVEEFWDPKNPELDRLQVTREIPMLCILLSKDQLDPNELGYQAPEDNSHFPKRAPEDNSPFPKRQNKRKISESHKSKQRKPFENNNPAVSEIKENQEKT